MKCYLCNSDNIKIVRNKVRHDIPREVLECQDCGLNYLRPIEKNLKEYYTEEYRKKYTPVINDTIECKDMFDLMLPYQQLRINEIKHLLNPKMKLLEVGSSTGHFLYALKDYVKECIGIEYNTREAEFTNKKLGIKTYTTSIEETNMPKKYFDLIAIYQVLEHVNDPINFLKIYKDYLKEDGYICIEVPNIEDILMTGYNIKSFIDFWYREPHLFNFSTKTLTMLLKKAGFKGTVKGVQYFNFLNHLHWIFTSKPQKSYKIGWSKPVLINNDLCEQNILSEFNEWFEKVDEEYKNLLVKYNLTESILFIGQMF